MPVRPVAAQLLQSVAGAARHRIDPQWQLATIGQALIGAQLHQGNTRIMDAGQAVGHRFPGRDRQHPFDLARRGRRLRAIDQRHRGVDHDAGRTLSRIPHDLATIGLPVAGQVTADHTQGSAVGPAGMVFDAR